MKNQRFKPLHLATAVFTATLLLSACDEGANSSKASSNTSAGSSSNSGNSGGSSNAASKTANGGGAATSSHKGDVKCKASNPSFRNGLYDDTYIVKASMPNTSKKIDPNDPNIVETCGFGTVCYVDDYKGAGHVPRNGGKAFCAKSILDDTSPYKEFGSDLGFKEYMRYPTKLEIDCRSRIRSVIASQAAGGTGSKPVDPNNKNIHPNGSIMNCTQPGRIDRIKWPVAYGKGPAFSHFNSGAKVWYGAEFNPATRELFAVVQWNNSNHSKAATIVAWNVDTKNRRIVSGIFPHKDGDQTFGSGYESPISFDNNSSGRKQPMTRVDSIRLAKDGYLYASSPHEIIKVNPTTGKRELIWRRQVELETGIISDKYGQCLRPSYLGRKDGLQLILTSFAVGPDGKYYKGFRDTKGGNGVIQLSKDAKTCTLMARYNGKRDIAPKPSDTLPAPADVGTGFKPSNINTYIKGMLVHDGKLYYANGKALVSLDLATKQRKRVDDGRSPSSVGYTSMYYDTNRKVIWTSGADGVAYGNVVVDPITGQKELYVTDNGQKTYGDKAIFRSKYPGGGSAANTGGGAVYNNHLTQKGGVIVDPKDPDISYGVTNQGALLKLEFSTFNNYVHSWGQDL